MINLSNNLPNICHKMSDNINNQNITGVKRSRDVDQEREQEQEHVIEQSVKRYINNFDSINSVQLSGDIKPIDLEMNNEFDTANMDVSKTLIETDNAVKKYTKMLYDLLFFKKPYTKVYTFLKKIKKYSSLVINEEINNATIIQHALNFDSKISIINLLLSKNVDIYKTCNGKSIFDCDENSLSKLFHAMIQQKKKDKEYYKTFLSKFDDKCELGSNIINSTFNGKSCFKKVKINPKLKKILLHYNVIYFAKMIKLKKDLEFYTSKLEKMEPEIRETIIIDGIHKIDNEILIKNMLQRALVEKNMELFKYFIEHGANIFSIPVNGNSTLHLAINDVEILKQVLEIIKSKGLKIPIEIGKVIYYAIFEKKIESFKILLDKESEFRQFINIDIANVTPLHVALGEGHIEATKILIENGADLYKRVQKDGLLPIHVAAAKGNFENFEYLVTQFSKKVENDLKNGILSKLEDYIMQKTRETKMTPLHYASFRNNIRIVNYILNLFPQNPCKFTNLSLTHSNSDYLNDQSASGMTPLTYSISVNAKSVLLLLLARKPDLSLQDINENDAIVYASYKNRYFCGVYLLNYLNQYELELELENKIDLLSKRKTFLLLSNVNTKIVNEYAAKKNPTFDEFIIDIRNIRKILLNASREVADENIKWRKTTLLHLQYLDDAGKVISKGSGVSRDYYSNAVKLILNSHLFTMKSDGIYDFAFFEDYTEQVEYMRDIGYFLALITFSQPVNFPIADYIFKGIAGAQINETDLIELVCPEIIKGINNIKHYNDEEIKNCYLPFSIFKNVRVKKGDTYVDERREIFLSENPEEIINKDNIDAFRNKVIIGEFLLGGKKELLEALKNGFYELIPNFFMKCSEKACLYGMYSHEIINWRIVKKFITYKEEININLWKKSTAYQNCNSETIQVKWFWNFIEKSTDEKKRQLLKFATGSSLLPIGGFKFLESEKIPFTIQLDNGHDIDTNNNSKDKKSINNTQIYPMSRTCMYTIIIPKLDNEEQFIENLDFAITNYSNGMQFI